MRQYPTRQCLAFEFMWKGPKPEALQSSEQAMGQVSEYILQYANQPLVRHTGMCQSSYPYHFRAKVKSFCHLRMKYFLQIVSNIWRQIFGLPFVGRGQFYRFTTRLKKSFFYCIYISWTTVPLKHFSGILGMRVTNIYSQYGVLSERTAEQKENFP